MKLIDISILALYWRKMLTVFAKSSNIPTMPDSISQLTNNSGYITSLPTHTHGSNEITTMTGYAKSSSSISSSISLNKAVGALEYKKDQKGTSNLTLGTTSSTAYRGDYGNTAYLHALLAITVDEEADLTALSTLCHTQICSISSDATIVFENYSTSNITNDATYPWTFDVKDGRFCLMSTNHNANCNSYIKIVLDKQRTVRIYSDAESSYDFVYINTSTSDTNSSSSNLLTTKAKQKTWQEVTLDAGTYYVHWRKDSSVDAQPDCGWVSVDGWSMGMDTPEGLCVNIIVTNTSSSAVTVNDTLSIPAGKTHWITARYVNGSFNIDLRDYIAEDDINGNALMINSKVVTIGGKLLLI